MTYNSDELVQYLSLANLTQLRYEIDADALEIFQLSPGGKRVLYEGSLSKWRECGQEGGGVPKKRRRSSGTSGRELRPSSMNSG